MSNTPKTASESIFSNIAPSQRSPVTFTPNEIPAVANAPAPVFSQADATSSAEEKGQTILEKLPITSQPLLSSTGTSSIGNDITTNGEEGQISEETGDQLEQEQVPVQDSDTESPLPSAKEFSRSESAISESSTSRRSWIETLRKSAMENRTSRVNKKRPLEAEALQPEEEIAASVDEPSVQVGLDEEVPKPKRAHRKQKKSLALASIAPLPTLPILEQVKKLTEVKRPLDDETVSSRTSQIDEDEMLLSAARIAAEQLKNGPRLIDRTTDHLYMDPFRSSIHGRSVNSDSRLSSSLSSSLSGSSPYARVNGYDVALAPETPLGLGRTLSRTEQRLRLTGGKGLAYKPLQLTPENTTSSKKSAKKRSLA